jgi:methionyl aminopeptidase
MKPGMVFTIEPMVNYGKWQDVTWPDDWTMTTIDGERSAQFEHTVLVTPNGCEVLTARTEDSVPLWWEAEAAAKTAATTPADSK